MGRITKKAKMTKKEMVCIFRVKSEFVWLLYNLTILQWLNFLKNIYLIFKYEYTNFKC